MVLGPIDLLCRFKVRRNQAFALAIEQFRMRAFRNSFTELIDDWQI